MAFHACLPLSVCVCLSMFMSVCVLKCTHAPMSAFAILGIGPGLYTFFSLCSLHHKTVMLGSFQAPVETSQARGWGWVLLEHVILTQALSATVQPAYVGGLLRSHTRGHLEASCFLMHNQFQFFCCCPCPSCLPHFGVGNKLIS